MNMKSTILKIHPNDNVAVALSFLKKGMELNTGAESFILEEDIPQGHKLALRDIPSGTSVVKYGSPIGTASSYIQKGSWVHTHNLKTDLDGQLTYSYKGHIIEPAPREERFFSGYRRSGGKAGVRNEIWIIPTVGCVNSVAQSIAAKADTRRPDGVDSIVAFPHPYGCSQLGDDQENTRLILADLINHPNAGGVLVLGLGCENSSIEVLKSYIGEYDPQRVRFLVTQECVDEIAEGLKIVRELCDYASSFQREPISCRELIVGLKCGGSDGLSGITANPTVGVFSDLLIARGGTTILTEVPEMFGAEALLLNRCRDEAVFRKTVDLINSFKNYFQSHGQTIYENPSPGNKKGGISTLEDKSLGCTQKSGSAPVEDVLRYGQAIKKRGLNLLSAPGNDLVASTALAAAGAQIILFTTGRGTPFASPVPTVKISSNSALFESKPGWIDFNCGTLAEGGTVEETGAALFDHVLEVASGRYVRSEEAGFHDMAIFKQGVTL